MIASVRAAKFFWILFVVVLGVWLFIGCGGGGGGETPLPINPAQGNIYGTVVASTSLPSIRGAVMPSNRVGIEGAQVYLESDRDRYNTLTASGGRFNLAVPYGVHRVVTAYSNSWGTYKARSGQITISETSSGGTTNELQVAPAVRTIRGILLDKNGKPIPNATMYVWGERFQTDTNGEYTTPPLPDGADAEIIIKTSGYQETRIPASFSAQIPPYIITTVPALGDTNRAPIVSLQASSYAMVSPGKTVEIIGKVVDPDGDTYQVSWRLFGAGQLSTFSTNILKAVWTAPSGSGVATVSLVATDSRGLSGTVYLGISYGISGGNTKNNFPPAVNIIATGSNYATGFWFNDQGQIDTSYPALFIASGETITLIANASDEDGDPLSYYWFASTGSFNSSTSAQVVYTPPPIATWAFIEVYVYDTRNAVASASKIIGVAKDSPRVAISKPINGKRYSAGWIELAGQASDTSGRLIYPGGDSELTWLIDGRIVATNAIETWVQVFTPGSHTVAFQVKNRLGVIGSASVGFYINATPTVTIASPTNNSVFKSGAVINLVGSAVDVEDGAIASSQLSWKYNNTVIKTGSPETYNGFTAAGSYTITLVAKDSHGDEGQASVTIGIRPNATPTVSIASPTNNEVFLGSATIVFRGSATDDEDGPLTGSSLTWLDGSNVMGTGETYSTNSLSIGTHTITLLAKDSQNYVGSASISIFINATPSASISSPTMNERFDSGTTITLRGVVTDPEDTTPNSIRYAWYDQPAGTTTLTLLHSGTTSHNNICTFNISTLSNATHTIWFIATDSYNAQAVASVTFLVNTLPLATLSFDFSSVAQYATATIEPKCVFLASDGIIQNLKFSAEKSDPEGSATTIVWSIDGGITFDQQSGNLNPSFNWSATAGIATIAIEVADSFNRIRKYLNFRIVDSKILPVALNNPTGIDYASNYLYVATFGGILKIKYDDFTTISSGTAGSEDGKFDGIYAIAVSSTDEKIVTAEWYNNDRLQVFKSSDLSFLASGVPGLNNAKGLAYYNGVLYVADTGNNSLKRFTIDSGGTISGPNLSYTSSNISSPESIRYASTNNRVYCANYGNNQILIFDSLFNLQPPNSISLNGVLDVAVGSNYLFCLTATATYILDASTGSLKSWFGGSGSSNGEFNNAIRCILQHTGSKYYYYVLESGTPRIQRFDFGSSLW